MFLVIAKTIIKNLIFLTKKKHIFKENRFNLLVSPVPCLQMCVGFQRQSKTVIEVLCDRSQVFKLPTQSGSL
jgi:hypothetical protein